jgi:hypothetical protein
MREPESHETAGQADPVNVRVVGGDAGWEPAPPSPPPVPVLTPEQLVRTVLSGDPIGTEPSQPEVLHASTTVAASQLGDPVLPADGTVLPPAGTRVVRVGRAERWAPVTSAAIGTFTVLIGLLLGAAAAYAYGDPAACQAFAKAHKGASGFGCTGWQRKGAVIAPMIGLPLLVIGWLAFTWIPDRSGTTRIRLCLGLLGVVVLSTIVAVLGIKAAV